MAYKYYAVKRGFDKETKKSVTDKIFEDWNEVKPLVKNVDNARYKGFNSKEMAEAWLDNVDKEDNIRKQDKPILKEESEENELFNNFYEYFKKHNDDKHLANVIGMVIRAYETVNS